MSRYAVTIGGDGKIWDIADTHDHNWSCEPRWSPPCGGCGKCLTLQAVHAGWVVEYVNELPEHWRIEAWIGVLHDQPQPRVLRPARELTHESFAGRQRARRERGWA